LIFNDATNNQAIRHKEQYTHDPNKRKGILPLAFNQMGSKIPSQFRSEPADPKKQELSFMVSVEIVLVQEKWQEGDVPHEILGSHNFVKHNKDKSLHETTEGKVSVVLDTSGNKQGNLRDKGEDRLKRTDSSEVEIDIIEID